jgi:hypothetical protein
MAVSAPTKNKTCMEAGDVAYVFEKALGMFYIRTNLRKILSHYKESQTELAEALNDLVSKGQESETWKYWESTQTIAEHIQTGRV